MKRSHEETIVLNALQNVGCEITADIRKAVSDGLREIRRERYEERKAQKAKMKCKKQFDFYQHLTDDQGSA